MTERKASVKPGNALIKEVNVRRIALVERVIENEHFFLNSFYNQFAMPTAASASKSPSAKVADLVNNFRSINQTNNISPITVSL